MNEENIIKEIKDLKKKVEHIRNINRTTNILLALFLLIFILIASFNGFRWV
ncbi:MAG: hypothetical protein ACFFD5_03630 [Candidatus Thorarchaeota archaeon]